jgi:hypothetical protein
MNAAAVPADFLHPLAAYHLISFPWDNIEVGGTPAPTLASVLYRLGPHGAYTWRGFALAGSDTTENPLVSTGQGYWVNTVVDVRPESLFARVIGYLPEAPVRHLASGWNIVGTPSADSILSGELRILTLDQQSLGLEDAYRRGVIDGLFHVWVDTTDDFANNGEYRATSVANDTLAPWAGKLLYAYQECDVCFYCGTLPTEGTGKQMVRASDPPLQWSLTLSARSQRLADGPVRVGAAEAAEDDWDPCDHPKPPPPGPGLRLGIEHRNWGRFSSLYAQSIAAANRGEYRWRLSTSGAQGSLELTWSGVETLPEGYRAYLVLPAGGAVPLADLPSYTTPVSGASYGFDLLVTREPWTGPLLTNGVSGLLPVANPFRIPNFALRYQLVEKTPARLRIFDVRGRVVKDFGTIPSTVGTWEIPWEGTDADGRPVAAGVYFVHLSLGSAQRTAKLVVFR